MNKTKELILNSLEYYDKYLEKYNDFFSSIKYYSYLYSESDLEHNKIVFFDKNKQKIFESRFEIIGIYNKGPNIWAWAWSIPYLNKNTIYTSRKILNYGLDIVPSTENQFIKTELVTSRFRISHITQLDLHVSIASYLSKIPMIYKIAVHPIMAIKYETGDLIKIDKNVYNLPSYQLYFFFILDFDKLI
ncbi:Hypothetical protein KVN_LOCUS316 [uncultured virus]|nr:Hypothetical protein KVN_LOCUS316 [uncultured virus]